MSSVNGQSRSLISHVTQHLRERAGEFSSFFTQMRASCTARVERYPGKVRQFKRSYPFSSKLIFWQILLTLRAYLPMENEKVFPSIFFYLSQLFTNFWRHLVEQHL